MQMTSREGAKLSRYPFCLEGERQRTQSTIATESAVLDAVINGSSGHEVTITFCDGEPKSSPTIAQLAVAPGKTFTIGCKTKSGLSYSMSGLPTGIIEGKSYAPRTVLYRLLADVSGRTAAG
jgi:hypothetical protein